MKWIASCNQKISIPLPKTEGEVYSKGLKLVCRLSRPVHFEKSLNQIFENISEQEFLSSWVVFPQNVIDRSDFVQLVLWHFTSSKSSKRDRSERPFYYSQNHYTLPAPVACSGFASSKKFKMWSIEATLSNLFYGILLLAKALHATGFGSV